MKIIKLITLILFSFWASLGAQKENKQVYLQNTSSSTLEQLEELHIRGGLVRAALRSLKTAVQGLLRMS